MDTRDLEIALARALGWRAECAQVSRWWYLIRPDDSQSEGRATEDIAWALDGPHYSRNWAGLGLLVEAMRLRNWWFCLRVYPTGELYAEFYRSYPEIYRSDGIEAPQAAALAAARALGLAGEE